MADLKISAATLNPSPAGTDNFATDKAGADFRTTLDQIKTFAAAGGGDVFKVGTPVDNQLGVWTGDGTIEGAAGILYDTVNGLRLVTGPVLVMDTAGDITFAGSARAQIRNVAGTSTIPTLCPNKSDLDSGIGLAVLDGLSLIAGGVEMARFVEAVGIEQSLILNNDNTGLPDLGSLGDPDTGFNWDVANGLYTVQGGIRQYNWSSTSYFGQNSSGPLMSNVAGSLTVPTFCANRSDLTSGLGGDFGAAALVASSITGLAVRAANGNTMPSWDADLTITAFATGGQASATQLDAGHNVISTVATTGDSVKLLPIFLAGSVVYIKNNGVNAADVFPATGDDLGAGLNTAVSLAAGASISFIATVVNSTWTQLIVSAAGGGGDVTKVGTPVNNQVGVWTGDGTLEGDAGLTWSGAQLNIGPSTGSPGTLQLSFGDGDTGFYQLADDILNLAFAAVGAWSFRASSIISFLGPTIQNELPSATNPVFCPHFAETNTGIGWASDVVYLIGGGASQARTAPPSSGGLEANNTATGAGFERVLTTSDLTAAFPEFQFFADQLENPITADWTVNALAPAAADSNNSGLTVRLFDDTAEEGVGFIVEVPTGATNIVFDFVARAETAPGVVNTVGLDIYNRGIPNNAAVQAWSASTALTDISIPTNEFFQEDTQSVTLASLGVTAGETTQFELVRTLPGAGTDLTGDWDLLLLKVSFT